ncbi:hypothetical protein [Streptomyces qinglanensis]|uniref:hypothetical protein n=1 Tax=Streptomyces qinglanensis TaxID=943816 RepID=UPI000943ABCC|nr:hypothetical protein [Streptomyces qinglanensis]
MLLALAVVALSVTLVVSQRSGLKSFSATDGVNCSAVTGEDDGDLLDRLVPRAESFSVESWARVTGVTPVFRCKVSANGGGGMSVTVQGTGSREDWQKRVTEVWGQGSDLQPRTVDAYGKGFGGAKSVTLYAACKQQGKKLPKSPYMRPEGLDVRVVTTAEGDHEKELLTLAKRAAGHASASVGCAKGSG